MVLSLSPQAGCSGVELMEQDKEKGTRSDKVTWACSWVVEPCLAWAEVQTPTLQKIKPLLKT